ncbi:SRPBCC family protein [Phytoactinopolyspora mesophila]|uniref:Carbon monoxide dehydrogenase n=1 Tax=Phytoactinopolyspora mesophila TaxID=2650750 RepID=A0A7K3M614_9ACTN|nr:SRPBCC family protein [Phytoactinopolyspora mesophila]NDL58761.1 carbon monoxide dehydrogenase [Phytoactinopolyspora mesophila]
MQLDHQFTVPVPIADAWKVLLDVPRVAPCMPGATLDEFDGETFSGSVKVKLGPISLLYRGTGRFIETDDAAHRVVMEASGKEARGSGTAAATVTASMVADGDSTHVNVTTDLRITGRPAQFGRGMLNDVGGKLLGQFSDCLATTLGDTGQQAGTPTTSTSGQATEAAPATASGSDAASSPAAPSGTRAETGRFAHPERAAVEEAEAENAEFEVEPIDLLEITGAQDALRRYGPYAAGAALLAILLWIILRRRSK